MPTQTVELLERIRKQFNDAPYPNIPLEQSPQKLYKELYIHDLVTSFYLRDQKIPETEGKTILDVGCGSGYKSLMLAEANPGAKIVGIDLSEKSIELADQRLRHYGFNNAEFKVLTVEELPSLNMQFDYINCDEVLYLLLDPVIGLKAMKAVLKPDGILRANFHSALQRALYLQIQEFASMVGLMQSDSKDEEIGFLREIMHVLKNDVYVKRLGWNPAFEKDDNTLLANHLLRGDKGWTIPDFFDALRQSDLDFISMVRPQRWDLSNLFSDVSELPIEIGLRIAEASQEEQLHMYELLHSPANRLLDLWCGHPENSGEHSSPEDWSPAHWQQVQVSLHPQLLTEDFKQDLIAALNQNSLLNLSRHLSSVVGVITLDTMSSACLLPLLEGPTSFDRLVQRWRQLRPLHPLTLEPSTEHEAYTMVREQCLRLEELGYMLLDGSSFN